jgi:hypothetical protein
VKNLSTRQLADFLSVTKRTVQRRSNKEDWSFDEQKGLGGTKKVYAFGQLPEMVKIKVLAGIIAQRERKGASLFSFAPNNMEALVDDHLTEVAEDIDWQAQDALSMDDFGKQALRGPLGKDMVRRRILFMAREYVTHSGYGKIKGFDCFCQHYNNHTLDIASVMYDVVTRVSRITLLRWEKNGLPGSNRRVRVGLPDEVFDALLRAVTVRVMMATPEMTASRLRHHFLKLFEDKVIPSQARIGQWVSEQPGRP